MFTPQFPLSPGASRRSVAGRQIVADDSHPLEELGYVNLLLPGCSPRRPFERALLAEIARKASLPDRCGAEWAKVGSFLARQYLRQHTGSGLGERS